jgi:hypothetical protein
MFARVILACPLVGLSLMYACSSSTSGSSTTADAGNDASLDVSSSSGGGSSGGASTSSGGASSGGAAGDGGSSAEDAGRTDGGGTPCDDDEACDDQNPCNGTESCASGICAEGSNPLSDGDTCAEATDAGLEAICVGDACRTRCAQDSDCDDGNPCTGVESCSPSTQTCQAGTPPTCDDGDDCTEDECDPTTGCYNPLIDGDGDGHADEALGRCGDDCDDDDETVFPGAGELCDGEDNDCNGIRDDQAPVWYLDCDGDGYARAGAASITGCDAPTDVSDCDGRAGAGWTTTAPGPGTTDCWDESSSWRPMTAAESNTAWTGTGATGAPAAVDFDRNCDGREEQRYQQRVSTSSACNTQCSGGFPSICGCTGLAGWVTSAPTPECGIVGSYTYCQFPGCGRVTDRAFRQECR